MNESRLTGRHIVVTGAGTGIGRGIALRIGRAGGALTLVGRNRERLLETAAAIGAGAGPEPFCVACDVSDRARVEASMDEAVDAHGPFHGLIANAGLGGRNWPGADDRFDEIVQTNLYGSYWCARAVESRLADGPGIRHMIFISSILAKISEPGRTAYSASKSALLGLVKGLAMELAPRKVQVNAICPGWVNTVLADEGIDELMAATGITDRDEAVAEAMKGVPIGFMNEPEEIGGTVLWLLSPDGRGVTGQSIDQNGGVVLAG